MSFYKDRNERIKTGNRNDSSNLKKSFENYGKPIPDSQRSINKNRDNNEGRFSIFISQILINQ